MTLGRTWRTLRHLSVAQTRARLDRRRRELVARTLPRLARARVAYAAEALALPDPARPALLAAARHVGELQDAVHGPHLDAIRSGKFTLLNRTIEFDDPAAIDWGGDFGTGDDALLRMTLGYLGFAVPLLASGEAGDLALVAAMVRSLDAGNPWRRGGVFRDVWNPYTASHRVINLVSGLALHGAAGGDLGDKRALAILEHVRFSAAYVRRNLEFDLGYNHLLKNTVALAVYAAGLGGVPPQWDFLEGAVRSVLARLVLADGGHAERSPMYHLLGLIDLRILIACALFGEQDMAALERIAARMETALATLTHPDGDIALFNDSWLGEGPPASRLLTAAAPATARLADAGYVRLGEGGDAVIFDCGACGPDDNPAHAHADFLAIEASVDFRRLIVDPGVATYAAGDTRDACRRAAAHNGPCLEGREPIEFWRAFRVGRRASAGEITDRGLAHVAPLWCAGRTLGEGGEGGRGGEMRRFVGLWPSSALVVCDVWIGADLPAASSRFLIAGGWRMQAAAPMVFEAGESRVELSALAGRLGDVRPAKHWVRFGVAAPAHRIVLDAEAGTGFRRAALWVAWGEGAMRPDTATLDTLFRRLAAA